MKKIHSFNEWDPLKEVIIGTATNAKYPKNDLGLNMEISFDDKIPLTIIEIPDITQTIIDETNEDLNIFAAELEKLDIIVRRPNTIDTSLRIKTPYWETPQYFNYCPRDIFLVVGDMIIETPNFYRSRYFETFAYRDILLDYLKSGCKWISGPKPMLRDEDFNFDPNASTVLREHEPIFDAANIIRAGKDLFYLLSNGGNELGFQWLQTILDGEYNIHPIPSMYSGTHIDTTLVFLKPGLVLANPERVNDNNLPEILKKWEVIYSPPMVEAKYSDSPELSSSWLGMNIFMINPSLAVVDAHQKELIEVLENHNIDVLPLKMRHGRTMGGGFHCVTLDIFREGEKENYFS